MWHGEADTDGVQNFGGLVIHRAAREVTLDGKRVSLTPAEYTLLATLTEHPRRAISSRELLRAMWGSDWAADTTALQVHISRLRSKLGERGSQPRHIVTIHGFGYRFDPEPLVSRKSASTKQMDTTPHEGDADVDSVHALVDLNQRILGVSSNVETLLGWKPGDLEGTLTYDLLHPADRPAIHSLRKTLDAGRPTELITRLRMEDGAYRRVEGLVQPVIGLDGTVERFALQWRPTPTDSDAPSRTHVVELSLDSDLILRAVHPHEPFLGYSPADIIGSFFSPTGLDERAVRGIVDGMLRQGINTTEGPVTVVDAHGAPRTVNAYIRLHADANGEIAGLSVALDIPP